MLARSSHQFRTFVRIGMAAATCLACSVASAEPLVIKVNPQLTQRGVLMTGNEPGTIQTLFDAGPRYGEPSGIRVGRGSQIPDWLDLGSFQNVGVPGLNPVGYYGYYISPDDRAVVIDLASRRVVRVVYH